MCSANVCFAQFLESLSVGALEDRGNARQRNVLGVLSAMAFAAVSAPERMITLFPEAKSFAWCRQKKATKQTCKLFSPFFSLALFETFHNCCFSRVGGLSVLQRVRKCLKDFPGIRNLNLAMM